MRSYLKCLPAATSYWDFLREQERQFLGYASDEPRADREAQQGRGLAAINLRIDQLDARIDEVLAAVEDLTGAVAELRTAIPTGQQGPQAGSRKPGSKRRVLLAGVSNDEHEPAS